MIVGGHRWLFRGSWVGVANSFTRESETLLTLTICFVNIFGCLPQLHGRQRWLGQGFWCNTLCVASSMFTVASSSLSSTCNKRLQTPARSAVIDRRSTLRQSCGLGLACHRFLLNHLSVLLHHTDTASTYETRRSEPSPSAQPNVSEAFSSASTGCPSLCT